MLSSTSNCTKEMCKRATRLPTSHPCPARIQDTSHNNVHLKWHFARSARKKKSISKMALRAKINLCVSKMALRAKRAKKNLCGSKMASSEKKIFVYLKWLRAERFFFWVLEFGFSLYFPYPYYRYIYTRGKSHTRACGAGR